MIVAIMQPYFFPYIGYFQLMAACQRFVLHDDTQFVKNGWIHRNRILFDGSPRWLTMPVAAADHRLPILRREYTRERETESTILRRLRAAYAAAPYLESTLALVETAFDYEGTGVASFNANLLQVLAREFGLTCRIVMSSALAKDNSLRGQDRVLAICSVVEATHYINPPGGRSLYDSAAFRARGLELEFLVPRIEPYAQGGGPFVGSLSIIDVLMFNGVTRTAEMIHTVSDDVTGVSVA